MTFPDRNLKQTAVYWGSPASDGSGGFTYADPVEIDCRWVDTTEVITLVNGEQVVCKAAVQVSQDLDEQGLLYLGTLDDLDSAEEESPETITAAYAIRRFDKVPTVKGTAHYRCVYL